MDQNTDSSPQRFENRARREPGELSTLVSQPVPKSSWKDEVNRKLEAHKSRRGIAVVEPQPRPAQTAVSGRAAQAAARVAARYARTPSFSEMQAAEARGALRAAEEATRRALEAQAAAQAALAELTAVELEEECEAPETDPSLAVAESETAYEPVMLSEYEQAERTDVAAPIESVEPQPVQAPVHAPVHAPVEVRWEADMPVRHAEAEFSHAAPEPSADLWTDSPQAFDEIETVEPAQPIPANLIEFPRELVATRRMRPRLAGAPQGMAEDASAQLSIFEVDPGSISTEPALADTEAAPAPSWSTDAEWTGIELDNHAAEDSQADQDAASHLAALELAPLSSRLLATAVDNALIVILAAGVVAAAATRMAMPPVLRTAEVMGAGLLLLTGVLYHLLCLTTLEGTPGMKYAGIALCTFDDERPSGVQLRERLLAMVVSLLPLGLGLAWSAFDENHLCWHDRLSRTYLRKR
jgi:uncharacterized RDD family membrane protein YckC